MKEYFVIEGQNEGPTSVIMAGIHGNEPCGVRAFKKLEHKLKIKSGKVIFLLGNPVALKDNVRFVEQNMNRMFAEQNKEYTEEEKNSYEYRRAQFIKMFLDEADALLDIHSTRNKSLPFVFTEGNAFDIVNYFPKEVSRIVININEYEPGGTDGYMYEKDKIGICIECGQHDSKNADKVAIKSIMIFLQKRGHIKDSTKKKLPKEIVMVNSIYFTKTDNFKMAKQFVDFEKIKMDQLIGTDGNEEIRAKQKGLIMFAHDCDKIGSEAFLMTKKI
ncbi:MAG: succinylglutamate desuccinylase/aspartoacylase family protein [Candidatus Paceibacterota bacterium]